MTTIAALAAAVPRVVMAVVQATEPHENTVVFDFWTTDARAAEHFNGKTVVLVPEHTSAQCKGRGCALHPLKTELLARMDTCEWGSLVLSGEL